jgi:hypothetical protein
MLLPVPVPTTLQANLAVLATTNDVMNHEAGDNDFRSIKMLTILEDDLNQG